MWQKVVGQINLMFSCFALSTGFIWTDVLLIDEVLPEARLQEFAFEVVFIFSFYSFH